MTNLITLYAEMTVRIYERRAVGIFYLDFSKEPIGATSDCGSVEYPGDRSGRSHF